MQRSLTMSLCAALVALVSVNAAQADDLNLDLDYNSNTGTWELYALVVDNAGPNSGDNGLAAVRAMIDNIDYGTNGSAVTIAGGIGAINPVNTSGGPRNPVLQTAGGTLDVLYGQDISVPAGVVGGVGVGSRALIASGTYSGIAPAFGDDDQGLTSDANFLAVAAPGTQTAAYAPDAINLMVNDVTPGGGINGDYDNSGQVGQGDLDLVLLNWGATAPPVPAGWVNEQPNGLIGQTALDGVLLNWGNTSLAGAGSIAAVPEPTSFVLGSLALVGLATARRRRS